MKYRRVNKKLEEREDLEYKSEFNGTDREWLKLIKTIVAMANRSGGIIRYKKINVKLSDLDSANLDNKVNSYISPKIRKIEVKCKGKGIEIKVYPSMLRPHIFIKRGIYRNEKGQEVVEFYEGQIWTRHSSKNELFDKSDFDLIVKEEINKFLNQIHIIAAQYPASVLETSDIGPSMKIKPIKNRKEGIPVVIEKHPIDPNIAYPYQAKDLAQMLGKNINYIAKLLEVLKMKNDSRYNYNYKNSNGKIVLRKYNDECLNSLQKFILKNPNFNPWHDEL